MGRPPAKEIAKRAKAALLEKEKEAEARRALKRAKRARSALRKLHAAGIDAVTPECSVEKLRALRAMHQNSDAMVDSEEPRNLRKVSKIDQKKLQRRKNRVTKAQSRTQNQIRTAMLGV